jgi:translation initiation factor IF-2
VDIIKELMSKHSVMANINQKLDRAIAESVVTGLGYTLAEPPVAAASTAPAGSTPQVAEVDSELETRPPVITIMGHVDHGKTTLLDVIRQTNVAGGEAGGITQHIGAYQVDYQGNKLTFLDTPGHEAFTALRARGTQVTDLAVIVVAADDGVQPQTLEAINHAKAAHVPIVVAINKIDVPGANIDRVKQQLADNDVLVEDWGGDVPVEAISARQKTNIDGLLDMIVLVTQLRDLKANPNRPARGTIIEVKLDRQVGPVATALVQNGTLKISDVVVAGAVSGRIRTMLNDRGKPVRKADPSTPVALVGLSGLPQAGDVFTVVADERAARTMAAEAASRLGGTGPVSSAGRIGMEASSTDATQTQLKEFNLVIKTDTQGSLDAIRQSVSALSNTEVVVNVIHGGVGAISESDILLALASQALVIAFNVRVDASVRRVADQYHVTIKSYEVIYTMLDELQLAVTGMLEPVFEERVLGHAEVRQLYRFARNEVVAGCAVTDGVMNKGASCRVRRKGQTVYTGKISSLRRFKDAVDTVESGFECGMTLDDFRDIQLGDVIEAFGQERVR